MEFFSKDGHVARLMAAVSSAAYGINTLSLMYLLALKWEEMVQALRLLRIADSMYLGQTSSQTKQVRIIYINECGNAFLV